VRAGRTRFDDALEQAGLIHGLAGAIDDVLLARPSNASVTGGPAGLFC
jgi:hypothetical protein